MVIIYPFWTAHYLGLPYKKLGRDRAGLDDWGMLRLVMIEQFGLALHSAPDYNDADRVDLLLAHKQLATTKKYRKAYEQICVVQVGKNYLFGVKVGDNRMLTCIPHDGGCFFKYEHNVMEFPWLVDDKLQRSV